MPWTEKNIDWGFVYQGEVDYETHKPHGKGIMIQTGYDVCIGYFRGGIFDGPCFFIHADGTKMLRTFRDNALNGPLIKWHPDGQIDKSEWKNNVDVNAPKKKTEQEQ